MQGGHPSHLSKHPGVIRCLRGTNLFNSAELTEDQLLLLLESLEVEIVPQQLKLVRKYTALTLGSKQRLGVMGGQAKQRSYYGMGSESQLEVMLGRGK